LLYRETIEAYSNSLNIFYAGGLNALIEGICVDKNIKGRNLENRIDQLNTIFPENIVKNLHSFRFMGKYTVNELTQPRRNDLFLTIEVCEDLLNFLYELDYKTIQLNASAGKGKSEPLGNT
jgi:hypothetical protein